MPSTKGYERKPYGSNIGGDDALRRDISLQGIRFAVLWVAKVDDLCQFGDGHEANGGPDAEENAHHQSAHR